LTDVQCCSEAERAKFRGDCVEFENIAWCNRVGH